MQRSYFKDIRNRILPYLREAKEEIVVAMAWFTSIELFKALLDCRERGVRVEVVLLESEINFMYYAPDFNRLIEAGGLLRIARVENGFMHHKFCVVDGKIVITGSYNWTYYAETRNIENIVISDDPSLVKSYREEFSSLAKVIDAVQDSPRLEWEQIETCQNVDFENLNYEIETIARERNLPRKTVVKSNTTVTVETRPLNPVSRYDIGICVDDDIEVVIPSGATLPFLSEKMCFYSYRENRDAVSCIVVCQNANGERWYMAERKITQITAGRQDFSLTIELQFTLTTAGDLVAEIKCLETSKVMSFKTENPDFIGYEE